MLSLTYTVGGWVDLEKIEGTGIPLVPCRVLRRLGVSQAPPGLRRVRSGDCPSRPVTREALIVFVFAYGYFVSQCSRCERP